MLMKLMQQIGQRTLLSPAPNQEYRRFIDHYPVTDGVFGQMDFVPEHEYSGTSYPLKDVPAFFGLFDRHVFYDWFGLPNKTHGDFRTAYAYSTSHFLDSLLEAAGRGAPEAAGRVLLLGNADPRLSAALGRSEERAERLARLKRHFQRILSTSKDLPIPGVHGFPMGLCEYRLRAYWQQASASIGAASLDLEAKPLGIFAAWHDKPYSNPPTLARRKAVAWAKTAAAQRAGVDLRTVEPGSWWPELARYKFLLTPEGVSVQTSKVVEALLVLTVPIVQRYAAFDDLVGTGFPIVVVDRWPEINASKVEEWWRALMPRLGSFRRNCLTTHAYWQLLTGGIDRCE